MTLETLVLDADFTQNMHLRRTSSTYADISDTSVLV